MSDKIDEIVQAASNLTEIEKIEVVSRILEHDKQLSAKWHREIKRRWISEGRDELEFYSHAEMRKELSEKMKVVGIEKETEKIYVFTVLIRSMISIHKRLVFKREYIDSLEGYMYNIISGDKCDNTFYPYIGSLGELVEEYEKNVKLDLPVWVKPAYKQ